MTEKKNSDVFLRPRFSIDFKESQEKIMQKFKDNLKDGDCKYCSKIVDGHVFIDIPSEEAHFWSPQLHVEIEEQEDKTTIVKGLFGPKPQVWTLFMFIHFILGTAFIGFATLAYSKWSLKSSYTFPLIMLVVLVVLWIVLYLLGQVGKQSSKKQMEDLHDFMQDTLDRNS